MLTGSQRAERLDAVRRHVRSMITQQNQQDQRDPEVTSNACLDPSSQNTASETAQGVPQCQGHTEGESIPISCEVQVVKSLPQYVTALVDRRVC